MDCWSQSTDRAKLEHEHSYVLRKTPQAASDRHRLQQNNYMNRQISYHHVEGKAVDVMAKTILGGKQMLLHFATTVKWN
jgi:hypothetical protein